MRANACFALSAGACSLLIFLSCPASVAADEVGSFQLPRFGGPSNWCIAQKTPIDCDLRTDCVWCAKPNSKIGTGCYPLSAAKMLPKSWGVECDKELEETREAATETKWEQQQQQGGMQGAACDGRPEMCCAGPECVWCTSAAVGGGCYTPDEAKLLPKAIFKCKTAPSDNSDAAATF